MLVGAQLGLNEVELGDLKWASILHDIGKIGIPESILNKPDSLTDDEYAIIKGHPGKGADILKPVDQLTGSISSIVHHHERYDGRGYPKGLKGDEIPLAARIIAAADTFDAINSHRAYRAAKSKEAAMAIIEEVSGSQLDPRVVAAFKKVYKAGLTQKKEEVSC
jgi:HD-GYP domain-containing protein (c-di-GMP phosphodiesterase class II)